MVAKVAVCVSMDTSGMCSMSLLTGLIRAVGITPANVPEASVTEAISADLARACGFLEGTAYRSGVFEQPSGASARRRPGNLLQSLANSHWQAFPQASFYTGLGNDRSFSVPPRGKCPLFLVAWSIF